LLQPKPTTDTVNPDLPIVRYFNGVPFSTRW
jgi:hypothetical protein